MSDIKEQRRISRQERRRQERQAKKETTHSINHNHAAQKVWSKEKGIYWTPGYAEDCPLCRYNLTHGKL